MSLGLSSEKVRGKSLCIKSFFTDPLIARLPRPWTSIHITADLVFDKLQHINAAGTT